MVASSLPLIQLIEKRYTRRQTLKGALTTATVIGLGSMAKVGTALAAEKKPSTHSLTFQEIAHGVDGQHHVSPGYQADILIRWGDSLVTNKDNFDPYNLTVVQQEKSFGYNNDFIAYMPLPQISQSADHGLLCVNHEYTLPYLMKPNVRHGDLSTYDKDLIDLEMVAHGHSIVEVKKNNGKWQIVANSPYNRRLTANTPMMLMGPVAGHKRLQTSTDPTGTKVLGTISNCSGGVTPWGTVLLAEENFQFYFTGTGEDTPEAQSLKRYGFKNKPYQIWGQFYDRFDIDKEPSEANRFGWIIEYDPYDPQSIPVKRTALGRFCHEGAKVAMAKDKRIVVYSGDDKDFEYVYKFVSKKPYTPNDQQANKNLLDEGTLYVAKFKADGEVKWLPLIWGQGPLTEVNGFAGQADVLIETRRAADLLGATKMDRPEDVNINPVTQKIYIMLTNNKRREENQVEASNPRARNYNGHIIELIPDKKDHGSKQGKWDLFIKAGDPQCPEDDACYNENVTKNGWFSCPDNCTFDNQGRLWITTDQSRHWAKTKTADGVWACETEGENRALSKMFFRAPVGAEVCSPCFTPDYKTMFLSVQHPAADGVEEYEGFKRKSTFADPATRWPDFKDSIPPRPAIVVITKDDGGIIGG